MDEVSTIDYKNEVRILNQLLAAQSIIHIFPNSLKIAEFLVQVLKSLPGVNTCSACLRNVSQIIGDNSDFADELMKTMKDIPYEKNHVTKKLHTHDNFVVFILQTTARQFGFIALSIDINEFEKYRPATSNFINTIALNLENHWRNEELNHYKDHLEDLVNQRTSELELKVAELKLAEEKINESIHLREETEKIGKVGGWELNIDTGKQIWTDEVYRIHEVDPTFNPDLENGINFYTPESLPIIENAAKHAIEHGEAFDLELDIISAKGNIKAVHVIGEADLQNRRVVGFFQDISERKKAEEKLTSEYAFRKSIELSLSSGIAVVNKEGQQIYVNPAFCRMVGWSEDELLWKTAPYVYWPPESLEDISNAFQLTINNMAPMGGFELVFVNKDNVRFPVQVNISPLIEGDQTVGWLANVQDITERKQAEDEIKQRNLELAELNASKDKFFSIIAHDLRSPFNGFLGLTKLMAEETYDFTLKELKEISQKMQNSANNLYKLLENLLEWSKIQRNLTEFKPQVCQLDDIIKQNIEIEKEFAQQKNIKINFNITSSFKIYIDIPMIDTVLRNLITNAIKFTRRGGTIDIGTLTDGVQLGSGTHPATCVYIKDNGIGMNADTLEKLFKIDENVTRPGTEKELSTGLGLLLCKEFVEKHGGKIWAESVEGKGSTFYFSLPENV